MAGEVRRFFPGQEDFVMRSERGVTNEPRNVAIYLTRILRREGLLAISCAFGMQGYSSASSAIDRVNKRQLTDKAFQQRIAKIKQEIICLKSQTET